MRCARAVRKCPPRGHLEYRQVSRLRQLIFGPSQKKKKKRRLFWTRCPPMAKGTAVTAVFPNAGHCPRLLLLSPKTRMMS